MYGNTPCKEGRSFEASGILDVKSDQYCCYTIVRNKAEKNPGNFDM